jgi:anti-sigma B factor antagonist
VVTFRDPKITDDELIRELGEEFFGLVDDLHHQRILLNFSTVQFYSSAALGKLITLQKKVSAAGGALRLCCLRHEIWEVLVITKLNRVFSVHDDEPSALAAF